MLYRHTNSLALITIALGVAVCLPGSQAQTHDSDHEHHMADVHRHGAEAMGFDQQTTEHHFRLLKDGGAVEVAAKDAADTKSIEQIRSHLQMQAKKFADGDFGAPQHTHGRVPPGVPAMQSLKSDIKYEFQQTAKGGKLRITSSSPQAIAAIHDFLKFQIEDHETGDPTTVQ